jgi:chaperonin GroES
MDWGSPSAVRRPGLPEEDFRRRPEPATTDSSLQEALMNLQPLGDRLIVEVLEEEETTTSGIVLPDTAREKPQRGRVLAVGPGSRDDDGKFVPMDLAEGDEIVFSKYGGTEIKVGTDDYLILRESDVLAKVVHTGGKGKRKLAGATA